MNNHQLLLQHDSTYYSVTYTTDTPTEITVLPADDLNIQMHLAINNHPLNEDKYNLLTATIMQKISAMPLWRRLGYGLTVVVTDDGASTLQLTCHIKQSIDIQGAPNTKVIRLDQIQVKFGIYSDDIFHVNDIYQGIHTLLVSLLLHWEYRFPLVFSVYGRDFFKLNYGTTIRTIDEIIRFESSYFKRHNNDRGTMLATAVTRMANYIKVHLTTIEMWKTFNTNAKIRGLKEKKGASASILHSVYLFEW